MNGTLSELSIGWNRCFRLWLARLGRAGLAVALAGFAGVRAETLVLSPAADTYIQSGNPGNNAGGHAWLDVGRDGLGGVRRGLLRFGLDAIPGGSTVTSVVMRLRVTKVPGMAPAASTVGLFRLQLSWGEGTKTGNNGLAASPGEATWVARALGESVWTVAGAQADAVGTVSASAAVGTTVGQVVEWQGAGLVMDVQSWLDAPAENHGWLLVSQAEAVSRSVRAFDSRESATGAGVLEVGFTLPPPEVEIIEDPIPERVAKGDVTVEVETVADGLASPLGLVPADDGSGRLFVYDQAGRVLILRGGVLEQEPLLEVRDRLVTLGAYDERGLLGFAVHPDFAENGLVYTYTSEPVSGVADFSNGLGDANNHQSVIAEWRVAAGNSNSVDVASRREVLRIDQPQSNHNGGAMRFGPEGDLYVVLGDGGQAHDAGAGHVEGGNAQATDRIWGKLLRITVNGRDAANGQYGIPVDNPFVGGGGLAEIYATGLRNPFSFSFDRQSGDLYLGDVGQGDIEEIDVVTAGGNYGWKIREGSFWFDGLGNVVTGPVVPVPAGLVDPIAMYDHDDGTAVIGGHVYRGTALAGLAGRYVFGDWGRFSGPSGRLFYLDEANVVKELRLGVEDRPLGFWIKGFGEDLEGELYVTGSKELGPSGSSGRVMKLVPATGAVELGGTAQAGLGTVVVSLMGGGGPFAVQRKAHLDDPFWEDEAATAEPTHAVATDAPSAFLRVVDLAQASGIPLTVSLSGAAERPDPVGTGGTGFGLFRLEDRSLIFCMHYAGLSGAAVGAHIHGAAGVEESAPVLIDLGPFNGGAFGSSGTLAGTVVLTDVQRALVLSGQTYVNVHTAGNPGGEIRGQIAPVLFQVQLGGDRERPDPVDTAAMGRGSLLLVGNELRMNVTYSGLSAAASAAHIHGPAVAASNAPVLIDLAPRADGGLSDRGSLSGTVTLTPEQLGSVVSGRTYINFHTPAHPGGELRGQILPKFSAVPLTAALSGLAERPTPLTNSASGSGAFVLDGDRLAFDVQYAGLSGPAVAAHLHGPAPASGSTGVVVNLAPFNGAGFGERGTFSGSVQLDPELRARLLAGLLYLNVHTAANPGGELRGQVLAVSMRVAAGGPNERPTPTDSLGAGRGLMVLTGDTLHLAVAYGGLTAAASAAHLHGPATVFEGAGVLVNLGPYAPGGFGISGGFVGSVPLSPEVLAVVGDGLSYLNVHTPTFPSGEIRGQVVR